MAQVMISRFVRWNPTWGSALTALSLLGILSLPLPCARARLLSQSKYFLKIKWSHEYDPSDSDTRSPAMEANNADANLREVTAIHHMTDATPFRFSSHQTLYGWTREDEKQLVRDPELVGWEPGV